MLDRTQPSLNGITAQAIKDITRVTIGAIKNTALSAPAGTIISLTMYLPKSAKLCSRPKAPTTLGPRRICTAAQTLRSAYIRNANAISNGTTTSRICPIISSNIPRFVLKKKSAIGPHTVGIPFSTQAAVTTSASIVRDPRGKAGEMV